MANTSDVNQRSADVDFRASIEDFAVEFSVESVAESLGIDEESIDQREALLKKYSDECCAELDRLTCNADNLDLLASVCCGVAAGIVDAVVFGKPTGTKTQVAGKGGKAFAFVRSNALLICGSDRGDKEILVDIHSTADPLIPSRPLPPHLQPPESHRWPKSTAECAYGRLSCFAMQFKYSCDVRESFFPLGNSIINKRLLLAFFIR